MMMSSCQGTRVCFAFCVIECARVTCPGVSPRDSWPERVSEKVALDSGPWMRGITGHHRSHQATGEMDSNSGTGARRGADHHWPRSVTDRGTRDLQVNSCGIFFFQINIDFEIGLIIK